MNSNNAIKTLERFSDECIDCGMCQSSCELLNNLGLSPGEIARAINNDQIDAECIAAIQRCDLCGRCSQDCLVNMNPADMIKAAREVLIQKGRIDLSAYDAMLVDRDWNFFTIYRDTYGINYDDLKTDQFETLFFPGCSLSSYAPELTRTAYHWLQEQGMQVGFTDLCCTKPLDSIGLSAEADHYLDRLRALLDSTGAHKIITACPNCESHLRSVQLPNIEINSIYDILVKMGYKLNGTTRLTFHDSCPDRYNPKNPQNVRNILSGYPQVEMFSHGKDAMCCGAGGIVSMIDPELCSTRALRRMAEFNGSGADTCITYCMGCAQRLSSISQPSQIRHCLEVVFDIQIDYEQVNQNAKSLWEGSQGEINLQHLAQAHVLPSRD